MKAVQVLFVDPDENDVHMGILIDHDYIVCAECGSVFEADEVLIIQTYDFWVNFESEIADELDLLTAQTIAKEFDSAHTRGREEWEKKIEEEF